jgi:hypothetical protein
MQPATTESELVIERALRSSVIVWWIGKDLEESDLGLMFMHYPGMRLEVVRKTPKNLSQDNPSPGRDLNPRPP